MRYLAAVLVFLVFSVQAVSAEQSGFFPGVVFDQKQVQQIETLGNQMLKDTQTMSLELRTAIMDLQKELLIAKANNRKIKKLEKQVIKLQKKLITTRVDFYLKSRKQFTPAQLTQLELVSQTTSRVSPPASAPQR
jgi:Spy/CpxP family protein refolding chaperone